MSASPVVESEVGGRRRRPNPGYRVAPVVTDAFTPWVTVLDARLDSGEYRWAPGPDGALVPTPLPDEGEATVRPARRWWARRSQ
jgi:hypothetical protein